MIFKLSTLNFKIGQQQEKLIDKGLFKLTRELEDYSPDQVLLRLTIRENVDKYHPKRTHIPKGKTYARVKPALANFEGSIYFRLQKNWIFARFKGQTLNECLDVAFERISKELIRFKALHTPSQSQYPDHSTIRGI